MSSLAENDAAKIRILAKEFGIVSIKLFGSRAKNTHTPQSDFDFLVRFGKVASLLDVIRFKQEAEQILGLPVDVVEEGGIPTPLTDRILSEAIAI